MATTMSTWPPMAVASTDELASSWTQGWPVTSSGSGRLGWMPALLPMTRLATMPSALPSSTSIVSVTSMACDSPGARVNGSWALVVTALSLLSGDRSKLLTVSGPAPLA